MGIYIYKKGRDAPLPDNLVDLSGLSFISLAAGKINETIKVVKFSVKVDAV